MPWHLSGPKTSASAPRKKTQSRKASRPRNIGRSLVNAGVREILREMEEDKNKTATAKPPPPSAAEKKMKRKQAAELKKIRDAAAASRAATAFDLSPAKEARKLEFQAFWKELPLATKEWKIANKVAPADTPSGLSKHVSDSILVFSSFSSQQNILTLEADMYRRNYRRKNSTPLEKKASITLQIDKKTGNITHRETDWRPNGNTARLMPGIFIWAIRSYFFPANSVCVLLDDEKQLQSLDEKTPGGLDGNRMYSHYVFAKK